MSLEVMLYYREFLSQPGLLPPVRLLRECMDQRFRILHLVSGDSRLGFHCAHIQLALIEWLFMREKSVSTHRWCSRQFIRRFNTNAVVG